MFFFNHHSYIKRSIFIVILSIFCFVTSGLGILAFPKPKVVEAQWVDIQELLNKVLLIVWKSVLFPLLRKIILSVITTGDFPMSLDEFTQWLYKDLGFQIVEAILNQYGLTLCSKFSMNIKIALTQSLSAGWAPDCTFDESWLATTIEDCIRTGEEACWAKVRKDFLKSFTLTAMGSNNQFGKWFEFKDTFYSRKARKEGDFRAELQIGTGFLGRRDCDKWTKRNDLNQDGQMQPDECPIVTPAGSVAPIVNKYGEINSSALKSAVWTDMVSLTLEVVQTLLNEAIRGAVGEINEWKSNQERKATTEYQEIKTQQRMGENKPIAIPEE